jgi:hypothetical protein
MRRLTVIFLCLFLISPIFAALLKDDQILSVTGSGFVSVAPDTANVRLGVEVSRQTAQEAQNDNAEIMSKVMSAIEKQGIAKDKIQTSAFNIYPEMKYEPNQPPKLVGYRCSNQVNATIEDLAKISRIIDAGISAGANQAQGVQFQKKDDSEARKQALELAVKEAQGKAQAVASAAGLKLKEIKSVIEGGAMVPPPSPTEFLAMRAGSGAETPISPGLLEIRGSVTIVYKVE